MILPNNGRVAIIDDKYKEVKPLFDILSKKRIPFNYYSGLRQEELPDNPDENPITILFLDLNIIETQHDPKVVISTLHPILKSICPGKSKPYFLVVWSKKINEYGELLEKHFNNNPDLNFRKPVKYIYLSKAEYFNYVDGNYTFQEDSFDNLVYTIKSKLDDLTLLRNFIVWENTVHEQTTETINEFSSFYQIDNNWDKNSKGIIYRLAKSIVGEDEIGALNDEQKLAKAFININSFLLEKIENQVEALALGTITGVTDNNVNIPDSITSLINSKLHISTKKFVINNFEQGCIYLIPNQDSLVEKIIWEKKFKTRTQVLLNSAPQLAQLDITPVCDYSRNKEYIRLIFGAMLNSEFYNDCKNKGEYYYQTPIFQLAGQMKFIMFDFRFIKTATKEEIIQRNVIIRFKLRREICTDIQSQLSNQINRPGISNV